VSQQSQRWLKAGVFATLVHDVRELLRLAQGRAEQPTAAIFESRTLQSTPESGTRAGYDGAQRRRGSQGHRAVETLGHLLAAHVTAADVQERSQVGALADQVHQGTGDAVEIASVDQGSTGPQAAQAAAAHPMDLVVVTLAEAKQGFVLLPKRWVVERSFGWAGRFRRLARDYEQLAETLAGLHFVAFAILMLKRFVELLV
jgi:transposase